MQWLSSKEMVLVTRFQNLNEAVCISHNADTLNGCIPSTILPPVLGK